MRMIKCGDCGADIPAKAHKCPHCGLVLRELVTYAGVVSKKRLASVDRLARGFLMIVLISALIALVCYVARKFM
jgi:hypothetical protein